MPSLIIPKLRSCEENGNENENLLDSHLQALISDEPRNPSESLAEKSALCCSLKRKRPPTIQIPAVLREIKVDPQLKSAEDRSFFCFGDAGFGVSSVKGKKKLMEDAHKIISCLDGNPSKGFFGVYDGHGGRKAAEFVAENLHINMFDSLGTCTEKATKIEAVKAGYLKTDKDFLELEVGSGACCVTAFIEGNEMIISNLGDCRAVLCRGGLAEALTTDHTAAQADERKRIEDKGGYVEIHRGGWRVHGVLSVSRSIGDAHLKSWVVAEPDTMILSLTSDMEFVVLASDGLWGKVGNQEVVDVVLRSGLTGKILGPAEELCKENSDEFVCINSSPSPKIKRVSVFKQQKLTSLSPSPQKKTAGNAYALDTENERPAEELCKENNDEFVCINSSPSPKIKRVSVVKREKLTILSPSPRKKTAGNAYALDTENESPPSKMRRTSLLQRSIKALSASEDSKQSTSKGLVTVCKELVNLALTRGSLDDITVMVIDLNYFRGISP